MSEAPTVRIDHEKLMAIKKKFRELPKVKRIKTYSGSEAVAALAREIQALSRKGYDPQKILDLLKEEGIETSLTKVTKVLAVPREKIAGPSPRRNRQSSVLMNQEVGCLKDVLTGGIGEEVNGEAEAGSGVTETAAVDQAKAADQAARGFSKRNGKEARL